MGLPRRTSLLLRMKMGLPTTTKQSFATGSPEPEPWVRVGLEFRLIDHEWRAKCLLEIVLPLRQTTMANGSTSVVPFSVEPYETVGN